MCADGVRVGRRGGWIDKERYSVSMRKSLVRDWEKQEGELKEFSRRRRAAKEGRKGVPSYISCSILPSLRTSSSNSFHDDDNDEMAFPWRRWMRLDANYYQVTRVCIVYMRTYEVVLRSYHI